MIPRPKIVVMGAGSCFFGRTAIIQTTQSEILRSGTLALVDTDPDALATMMSLGRRVIEATNAPTDLVGSTDRRDVLPDADFVVLTFSTRNAHLRGLEAEVSAKYGVTMSSADTIGPGGIFRALREIPTLLGIAEDIRAMAPEAWVINLVNPTAVLGIALMRYAEGIRSFALCDGNPEPRSRLSYLKAVGILPADAERVPPEVEKKLDLAIGGVNHFTWMVRFRYGAKDMLPGWRDHVAAKAANDTPDGDGESRFNNSYAVELMDVYGAYPTFTVHTKEYVPFYQGHGVTPVMPGPLIPFDGKRRQRMMDQHMAETRAYASGARPIAELFSQPSFEQLPGSHHDPALDAIESMWAGLGKALFVNSANRGAVTNMAHDAFLELRSDIDMAGPRPQPFGEMPARPPRANSTSSGHPRTGRRCRGHLRPQVGAARASDRSHRQQPWRRTRDHG